MNKCNIKRYKEKHNYLFRSIMIAPMVISKMCLKGLDNSIHHGKISNNNNVQLLADTDGSKKQRCHSIMMSIHSDKCK